MADAGRMRTWGEEFKGEYVAVQRWLCRVFEQGWLQVLEARYFLEFEAEQSTYSVIYLFVFTGAGLFAAELRVAVFVNKD